MANCKVQGLSAVSCAKSAETINMPFGMWIRVSQSKHVLDSGAHFRNLANTTERSMNGGKAAYVKLLLPLVLSTNKQFLC